MKKAILVLLVVVLLSGQAAAATMIGTDMISFQYGEPNLTVERALTNRTSLAGSVAFSTNGFGSYRHYFGDASLGANVYALEGLAGPYVGLAAGAEHLTETFQGTIGETYRNTVFYGTAGLGYKVQAGGAFIDFNVSWNRPVGHIGDNDLYLDTRRTNSISMGTRF